MAQGREEEEGEEAGGKGGGGGPPADHETAARPCSSLCRSGAKQPWCEKATEAPTPSRGKGKRERGGGEEGKWLAEDEENDAACCLFVAKIVGVAFAALARSATSLVADRAHGGLADALRCGHAPEEWRTPSKRFNQKRPGRGAGQERGSDGEEPGHSMMGLPGDRPSLSFLVFDFSLKYSEPFGRSGTQLCRMCCFSMCELRAEKCGNVNWVSRVGRRDALA